MPAIQLSRASLAHLPPPVNPPRFDPAQVTPGIVHLGLGNFHRAHMARYTHDLMDRDPADMLEWGIVGAGLMPGDRRMADSLQPQDGPVHPGGAELVGRSAVTVIGALAAVVFAGEDERRAARRDRPRPASGS